MKQVDADHTERFLLLGVPFVEHANVNDYLAWFGARLRLKSNAEPAVRFVTLLEAARRHRVREDEESPLVSQLFVEPLDQEIVLVIEHRI